MTALRILHVEDSPTDAKLIARTLHYAGLVAEITRVDEEAAMREALAGGEWDAILCDWSMPRFGALPALAVAKELRLDLPFIIISGTIGEEVAVDAMRAGAHDYVLKDRLSRLPPALERELRDHQTRVVARRSEAARLALEARFGRLTESGIIGVSVGNDAGVMVEANDAFLALIGYTRDDLVAQRIRWQDLSAPEFRELTHHAAAEVRTRGVAQPHEKDYIRKDGTRVSVLVGLAALDETHSIAFIVDTTARKRAEEALRRSEEQLRQAQKMEAVGRLAGGVAHDFNNILSVILSYGEIVFDTMPATDPARADIEEIVKAGRRAADLTRQLLMFSRQEVAEPRVIDVNELLAKMDRMLRRILGEDVDLASSPARSLGRISADPSHIEQVVMNLVVNARDAMPTGGKITIETADVDLDEDYARTHLGIAPGRYVMLAVSDTGIGMDRATQVRIFEPFFTTKDKSKGTGLGLSTVFGIVQQCHGSIWVYSEVGVGSTFKVYLPRVDAMLATDIAEHTPAALTGTETILLAEDDPQIRTVACLILRQLGYRVIDAANADEAVRASAELTDEIHLLVTDVVMPQMSGPELAKRLLRDRPRMRVLCMSGYTDDALVRHGAVDSGMAYLQKPITPDRLARKVRAVLDATTP